MYATDDNFVDESPGEDLVDDEDPGFGLNVCESDVEMWRSLMMSEINVFWLGGVKVKSAADPKAAFP